MSDLRDLNNYNCIVIIPMLNPDDKAKEVIDGVIEKGFKKIVVVDDGSAKEYKEPFEYAKTKQECVVLTHQVNQGKGRALKTAFSYIMDNESACDSVVTVDGDNQHKPDDIYNCVKLCYENPDALVLGCRDFSGIDLPLRSKFGNNLTSFIFKTMGVSISDTQTGLRVIPAKYLKIMTEIEGDRYEYETNMLLSLRKYHIPYLQQSIQTIYIEDNESSHFNPIVDSIKIYKVIFKYMFSSLTASVIDLLMFTIFLAIFNNFFEDKGAILIATVLARVISSLANCIINKAVVFKSNSSITKVLVRYYILCVCQTAISYILVAGLTKLLKLGRVAILVTIVKMVVDTVLFFVSYRIQKGWVYKEDDKAKD